MKSRNIKITSLLGILSFIILILAVWSFFISKTVTADASDGIKREKKITCISVKEGDTLWNIATDFYTDEYKDVNVLICEIKRTNRITDHIFIGENLVIPHYA